VVRFLLAVLLAAGAAAPQAAYAVDPPNWVAALHVAAQEAVGLRWNPVPGATGYKVLRSTTPGSGHQEVTTSTAPQYFDKAVEPGTTYYYVLQTVAGAETSGNSQERSVAIPGVKKKEVMPAPKLKDVSLNQITEFGKTVSKAGVAWEPVSGAIAYNVYRSTTKGKDYQMVTSSSEQLYVDATVEIGKTYFYVVSALDSSFQETPYSEERSVEVKEPEKKDAASKTKKEKVKMMLRKTTLVREIKEGPWGKLVQPSGVALAPNGDLHIVDPAQGKVLVFNTAGDFLFTYGEEQQLYQPLDLAISDEGEILVMQQKPVLELYKPDGVHAKTIDIVELMKDEPDEGKRYVERVNAGSGGRWYLSNARNGKIYVVDDGFDILETIGTFGKGPGEFQTPGGVFEDRKAGNLVVADTFRFQVKQMKDGKEISGYGSYGNSVGQFGRVQDVAVLENGDILTMDFLNSNIQGFAADGKFLYVLGNPEMNAQIVLTTPASIAVQGKRLYVANKLASSVKVFDLLDDVGPPQLKK